MLNSAVQHIGVCRFYPCNMCDPKTFTLEVTAEELVLLENALLGLVQVLEHNDALFLLLQRVRTLRPLPFVAPPTPSSSVRAGGGSLSQSPTRFSPDSPASSSMLASLGSPLPVVADQSNDESEVIDTAEEEKSNADQEIFT
jgi:hypothetical protein